MAVTANTRSESLLLAQDAAQAGCQAIIGRPTLEESLGYEKTLCLFCDAGRDGRYSSHRSRCIRVSGEFHLPHSVYHATPGEVSIRQNPLQTEAPPNGPNISALRDATRRNCENLRRIRGVFIDRQHCVACRGRGP